MGNPWPYSKGKEEKDPNPGKEVETGAKEQG